MRPGVNITTRESAPPSAFPTDVGVGFMVGVTESGPLVPVPVHNIQEYEAIYGTRSAVATTAYDSAKLFFDEGGYSLYVGRVVGPSAVTATVAVPDGSAATTLTANAKGPGEYGNDLNVVIRTTVQDGNIPANYFRVRVQTDAAVILEESPDLYDDAAAILWSQTTSQYITFVDGASANDPAAGTYALASGALDNASITDTEWATGIARFTQDMGPGQLFAPGRTTDVGHDQLADHAEANRRTALFDGADTATVATLTASAVGRRTRFGGIFVPWVRTEGVTAGSSRLVPPSAGVAGVMARNDGFGYSPNEPAAGERGVFRSVLAVTQTWSDADRQTLNNGGVNVIRDMFGQRKLYGYRTTANPITDANWLNLGNSRLYMAISAKANAVAERYMFRQIDGERKLINEFGGALIGEVLLPMFLAGSLFGEVPDDAFFVDVGPTVNTNATIQNNELNAVITVRMSPFGEEINIEIVKLLLTQEI